MTQEEIVMRDKWVSLHIPDKSVLVNVKLGYNSKYGDSPIYEVMKKTADLVYFLGNELHIVEFKVHDVIKGIGQLLVYEHLARKTERFSYCEDINITLHLICVYPDDDVAACCAELGILYEIFNY